MYLFIVASDGRQYVIKKSDIRRVYRDDVSDTNFIVFNNKSLNTPIKINETPEVFYNTYLVK